MRRHRNPRGGQSSHAPSDSSFFPTKPQPPTPTHEDGSAFFRESRNRRADQKARQLCRQVYRTLSIALSDCGDELLQNLTLIAVDPAPDAGHLLVTVSAGSHGDLAELMASLTRAGGRLRGEVARDIVRKRAPELSFRALPRSEVLP